MNETLTASADELVSGELFDLSLYRELRQSASGPLQELLGELIPVEEKHLAFWRRFFDRPAVGLGLGARIKLRLILAACRLFGPNAVHMVLEATEVYGIRKYLAVWQQYREQPLGQAVKDVLQDEFGHEDEIVSRLTQRQISPERLRNIFFGLNDGSVEVLGALSGFFAAFHSPQLVLMASSSVAVAGALSMAAGAYAAASSEAEVRKLERGKASFLGRAAADDAPAAGPLQAAGVVGASYFLGAMIPVTPVLLGASTVLFPLLFAGLAISAISLVLAYLSGMAVRKRILMNLGILLAAVGITYLIGGLAKSFWGISL
jgi:VIT1/CCC1 family predicted Fe2+/Mn2+ transporter